MTNNNTTRDTSVVVCRHILSIIDVHVLVYIYLLYYKLYMTNNNTTPDTSVVVCRHILSIDVHILVYIHAVLQALHD